MINDDVAPPDVTEFREQQSYEAFLNGDAVFMRGWPFMYALAAGDTYQVNQDQIGIAALPVDSEGRQSWSCLGGWNMHINASSSKKDAAWEFIKFMTDAEPQKFRVREGSFLPTLSSLYEDQEVLNSARDPAVSGHYRQQHAFAAGYAILLGYLQEALAGGFTPHSPVTLIPSKWFRISPRKCGILSRNADRGTLRPRLAASPSGS